MECVITYFKLGKLFPFQREKPILEMKEYINAILSDTEYNSLLP